MGKNIRYVAVYYGQGGFIPNDIDDILKNRFGDAKTKRCYCKRWRWPKALTRTPFC
jgi:hypothetical protein